VFHAGPGAAAGPGRPAAGAGADVGSAASIELRPRDCHTHVIPGVDDGSRTLDESLAMLRLLQSAGASRVIATPHIFPGRFPNEPEQLRPRFDALLCAAAAAGIAVELELGAEHYLDEHLLARVAAGRVLAFGPERYVLFEAHTGPTPPLELWPVVRALLDRGYTPLLAHVERYRWLRSGDDGEELIEDLRCAGVKFQVNRTVGQANRPGEGSRGRFLARAIARGWIDEVGSDLHRPTAEGRPYADDERAAPADASAHGEPRKPTRAVA
jgi:tyrosine-protein phosphatase YwqE